jgi:RNA polymerase sigma factor FliA
VAQRLGMLLAEFQKLLCEVRSLTVTGLDYEADEESTACQRQVSDDPARAPLADYERTESRERLQAAIESLPQRERQVVALYYLEELSMKEVGAVLGVTESRVSQIHTQAVLRLRASLAAVR